MILGYARGRNCSLQLDRLESYGIDELFSDKNVSYDVMASEESEYTAMLEYAQAGDTIVIPSFEVISRDYRQLLRFLDELKEIDVSLVSLTFPECSLEEYKQIFSWVIKNNQLIYPRLFRVGKEKNRNHNSYSIFSNNGEAKKIYRETMWRLLAKESLHAVAKSKGVPLETVYRIKQELDRIKLAVVLIVCFVLAIVIVKMTESYSDNLFIQLGVCVAATLVILYNTLVDSNEIQHNDNQ